MAMSPKDLKKQMAIPPGSVPAAKPAERRDRDRNRIRFEINIDKCNMFIDMLSAKLKDIKIDDPEFHDLYAVYTQLTAQRDKYLVDSKK